MAKVIVVDTETSGIGKEDQVIEFAYVELKPIPQFRDTTAPYIESTFFNKRYRPSVPIHPKAREVHGIDYKTLLGCDPSDSLEFPKDVTYMVAHNAQFDHRMLGKPEVKLICTLDLAKKMSKFLDIEFPNHKLDTLIEVLSPDNVRNESGYHSASGDILKNIIVLQELLKKLPNISSWDELWEFQQSMKAKPKKEKK